MFFPKPAPSAMPPYLMYPFHECPLEVGLATVFTLPGAVCFFFGSLLMLPETSFK